MGLRSSRRQLLRTTATAVGVAVAGCVSVPGAEPDGTESQSPSRQRGQQPRSNTGPHGPMTDRHRTRHGQMGPHHDSSGQHDQMGPHHGRVTTDSGTAGTLADWFANVDNYTEVVNRRGLSTVTVAVGAAGNGGGFAYDPPAIRIDQGATVTWEWTGEGGSHDVVAVDETFASDLVTSAGHTFTHTSDEPGTFRYYCTPHRALGMKGAVVVE